MCLFHMSFFKHMNVGSYSSWPELLVSMENVGDRAGVGARTHHAFAFRHMASWLGGCRANI